MYLRVPTSQPPYIHAPPRSSPPRTIHPCPLHTVVVFLDCSSARYLQLLPSRRIYIHSSFSCVTSYLTKYCPPTKLQASLALPPPQQPITLPVSIPPTLYTHCTFPIRARYPGTSRYLHSNNLSSLLHHPPRSSSHPHPSPVRRRTWEKPVTEPLSLSLFPHLLLLRVLTSPPQK